MTRTNPIVLATVVVLATAGTAAADSPKAYNWLEYEAAMYEAYAVPDNEDRQLKLAATILRIIQEADKNGRKPPPGIVAEYGFFLFQRGEFYAAIDHFRREAGLYPESEKLMDQMVRRAQAEAGS